jgi:hypothetical protein
MDVLDVLEEAAAEADIRFVLDQIMRSSPVIEIFRDDVWSPGVLVNATVNDGWRYMSPQGLWSASQIKD